MAEAKVLLELPQVEGREEKRFDLRLADRDLQCFDPKYKVWSSYWLDPEDFEVDAEAVAFAVYTAMQRRLSQAERELTEARAENARLSGWLEQIDGGDSPCTDESQLRQWAYEAITLRAAPPVAATQEDGQ